MVRSYEGSAWCTFIRAVISTCYKGSDWCPFIRVAFGALL